MHSDPFFPPVEPELLVSSFDTENDTARTNPEWERMLGPDGDPFGAMESTDAEHAWRLVESAASGRLTTAELFLIPGSPDPRPVLLNFLPVHLVDSGDSCPVVVTGEILEQPGTWNESQTEQHRMETLGRMTMGIAHDFNNLLSGIIGHSELMRSALAREIDLEVLEEHVRTIEQAAMDGGALIKKIQRYIRQEQKAAFIPLDLPSLIQDCVVLTRPYWYNEPRRQGISITVEQSLDHVPSILGSAAELRDVLVNLILNAVQAMPAGGMISLRCWHVEERVHLAVADTGVGMSDAVRARIFEPLYTTKGEAGTGMGLAVVSGVIQEHDGTIAVDTELGKGTKFSIHFPVGTMPVEDLPEPEPQNGRSEGLRVLVVDDEAMVRSVLRRLLALRGHSVIEAESGREALGILESDSFDVIITDHGMPEMNGREFATIVRGANPELPIVLLTGDTHTGESDETISAVLAKPFRIDEVDSTILELSGAS